MDRLSCGHRPGTWEAASLCKATRDSSGGNWDPQEAGTGVERQQQMLTMSEWGHGVTPQSV